jgi:FtsP/CotA-like multicopper oxidase with cupredoxin domain
MLHQRATRRQLLMGAASVAVAAASGSRAGWPQGPGTNPDHRIVIAPVTLELAPNKVIKTVGFNGRVPGPVLRLREGREVTIEVINKTDREDIVHWHGLLVPSDVDGAMEEGTPMVPAGGSRRYTFTPKPSGTRWYHSHSGAGTDLTRSLYAGEFGFLIVEPAQDPGRYDQEVLLAAHHWEPRWVSMQDIRRGPPPDNGLEVMYGSAAFNDRMLGQGDPIRVREGQRVLFRLLNASATEPVRLALPGHHFNVVALDGNPLPAPKTVDVIDLASAERADAIIEMNNPGIWILGAGDEDRQKGLGIVIEYANQRGEPRWIRPTGEWDYTVFSTGGTGPAPDETFVLDFEKVPGGRGGYNRWNINGKSFPNTDRLRVRQGKRYRLVMNNRSGDHHPVHLHRHVFELTRIAGKPMAGVVKDTVHISRQQSVEIDFVADQPGLTLLHCHQQDHMDEGFMMLMEYV